MKGAEVVKNIIKKMAELFPEGVEVLEAGEGCTTIKPKGLEDRADFYEEHKEQYKELWFGLYRYGFRPVFPDGLKWNGIPDYLVFLVGKFSDGIVIQLLGDFVFVIDTSKAN